MTVDVSCYPPTIRDLLRGWPTIRQLDILARADRYIDKEHAGRYYGGRLTVPVIQLLTRGLDDRC